MENEQATDAVSDELDSTELLDLIERSTDSTKFATRAIAQLFIYSALGSLLGGIFLFLGWVNIQNYNSGVGNTLITLGAIAAFAIYVWGLVEAVVSFRKSK